MRQVQEQLEGGKQQQLLIQERLNSGAAAAAQQPQLPFMQENSINTHAHPPMPDQGYQDDQAYQNDQGYPHAHDQQANQDDEIDMEFDPPGSAIGVPPEPPFGQRSDAGFGQDAPEEEAQAAGGQGKEPGPDELYSPGLSAQPSGSYMSDPGFQGMSRCHLLALAAHQLHCLLSDWQQLHAEQTSLCQLHRYQHASHQCDHQSVHVSTIFTDFAGGSCQLMSLLCSVQPVVHSTSHSTSRSFVCSFVHSFIPSLTHSNDGHTLVLLSLPVSCQKCSNSA